MVYCVIIMSGGNYKQFFTVGGEKHLFILDICVSLKIFAYKDKRLHKFTRRSHLGSWNSVSALPYCSLKQRPIAEAF